MIVLSEQTSKCKGDLQDSQIAQWLEREVINVENLISSQISELV